jgi:hypothetical protein
MLESQSLIFEYFVYSTKYYQNMNSFFFVFIIDMSC